MIGYLKKMLRSPLIMSSLSRITMSSYMHNVIFRIIMSSPSPEDDKVSFEEHPDANPKSREKGLKRFQMNPEPNWGPKNR